MHTLVAIPERVAPHELDSWLDRGWYRVGQLMMTCRFVFAGEFVRSAVWTRTPVRGRQPFQPSHRKLLSRAGRRFRVEITAGTGDERHAAVYERYLTVARGARPPTLEIFLSGGLSTDLFDTRCISLWAGPALAAFSLFDVGARATQSLLAAYDPAFASHSLGFTTLLMEIRWTAEQGLDHHYAGYVVPGDSAMDYKLRPRGVEFLDPATHTWRPWSEFSRRDWPAETLYRRLGRAAKVLRDHAFPARLLTYPRYDIGAGQAAMARCLAEPLVVDCLGRAAGPAMLAAAFDLEAQKYRLLRCARAVARRAGEPTPGDTADAIDVWVVTHHLATADTPEALVAAVAAAARPRRRPR